MKRITEPLINALVNSSLVQLLIRCIMHENNKNISNKSNQYKQFFQIANVFLVVCNKKCCTIF